jgi:hypothetical protein
MQVIHFGLIGTAECAKKYNFMQFALIDNPDGGAYIFLDKAAIFYNEIRGNSHVRAQ